MYVEFMKNFFSPIRESWWLLDLLSTKTLDSNFLHMMFVEFMKNFLLADWSEMMAVRLISTSFAQKRLILTFWAFCTSSSWKNFFLPIQASRWLLDSLRPPEAKKRLIPTFFVRRHDHTSWAQKRSWKIFFSPIRARWLLLGSFRLSERLFSRHDVLSSSKIFFSIRFRASWWLLDSFRPPESKNGGFLLSRHDVRRVHEKFSSCRFERSHGC